MFTLRVLAGTVKRASQTTFTSPGVTTAKTVYLLGPVQRRREQRDVIGNQDYGERICGLIK